MRGVVDVDLFISYNRTKIVSVPNPTVLPAHLTSSTTSTDPQAVRYAQQLFSLRVYCCSSWCNYCTLSLFLSLSLPLSLSLSVPHLFLLLFCPELAAERNPKMPREGCDLLIFSSAAFPVSNFPSFSQFFPTSIPPYSPTSVQSRGIPVPVTFSKLFQCPPLCCQQRKGKRRLLSKSPRARNFNLLLVGEQAFERVLIIRF